MQGQFSPLATISKYERRVIQSIAGAFPKTDPQQEKQNARQTIGAALAREGLGASPARFVRVSSIGYEHITADLAHIVQPGLDGLVLPKVETPRQIQLVDAILRAVTDAMLEPVIEAIQTSAHTGKVGDGKIFVFALTQVVRIRTGERDASAL